MSVPLYIRFGVHKDRLVLKETRDSFKGIVLPAHILAHTSDATRAAVDFIDKPYFIDPMTYILTKDNIKGYLTKDAEDKTKFKMSIEKMTTEYGIIQRFSDSNYEPLVIKDFQDSSFVRDFVTSVFDFQRGKVNDHAESAFEKYSKILKNLKLSDMKSTDHKPIFYTPPYFFFKDINDDWHDVNVNLAKEMLSKDGMDKNSVAPILLTKAESLTEKLLDTYSDFSNIIIWMSDLDESSPSNSSMQIKKLKAYKNFIEYAASKNIRITNLYGSYFSALLIKSGLSAFSNGIFYGEYKSHSSKVGGGAPPIRFYISEIHKFYLIPTALSILQEKAELFDYEPQETKEMLGNNKDNVAKMLDKKDYTMAQKHFLWARKQELIKVGDSSIQVLLEDLEKNRDAYSEVIGGIHKDQPLHLDAWLSAYDK